MRLKDILTVGGSIEVIRILDTHNRELYLGSPCDIPHDIRNMDLIAFTCIVGVNMSCWVPFVDRSLKDLQ